MINCAVRLGTWVAAKRGSSSGVSPHERARAMPLHEPTSPHQPRCHSPGVGNRYLAQVCLPPQDELCSLMITRPQFISVSFPVLIPSSAASPFP